MRKYIKLLKKAKGTRKLLLFIVFLYLAHGFLGRTFHLPAYWSYTIELCSILIWFRKPFKIRTTRMHWTFYVFCSLLVINLVGDLIFLVNPLNVLMGFRAIYLPMVFMFAAAAYLTVNDYKHIFSFAYYFQWLNLFCTFIQWFFYGLKSDFNNGALIGGAEQNYFCISLIVYYMFAYTHGQEKISKFLFVIASSFFIAIIQDEKFIFVGAMLCGLYYFIQQRFKFRNLLGIAFLVIGISAALKYMGEGQTKAIGSISNAVTYSQKTGAGYGFPRVGSAPMISEMFFHHDINHLMGLGLGTCTEMKAPGVDLTFSSQYGFLGYHLFNFQDVFLETGWVGIILYVVLFATLLIYNLKMKKKAKGEARWLYDVAAVLSLVAIFIIWYNCTLRIYYAVLPYILLGLGPCITKSLNVKK